MASIDYVVLRRPRLRGGIGGNTAVLLWSITGIVVLVIGLPFGLIATIPALLVQGVLLWAFRTDHKILEIYALYATLPDEFQAGIPHDSVQQLTRPEHFGKGVRL